MAKTATFNLADLNLSVGVHTVNAKSKALGFNSSDLSNSISYTIYDETNFLLKNGDILITRDGKVFNVLITQTLTVVNSNNESETATFTMPEGYTFTQFIGSEYDTSGGKFTSQYNAIYYGGFRLGDATDFNTASGTFYYAGEAPRYISGKWVFNETLSTPTWTIQTVNFTSGEGYMGTNQYTMMRYADGGYAYGLYYSNSGGNQTAYTFDTGYEDSIYKSVDFGSTPQTVSQEFYEWVTSNAVQEISS